MIKNIGLIVQAVVALTCGAACDKSPSTDGETMRQPSMGATATPMASSPLAMALGADAGAPAPMATGAMSAPDSVGSTTTMGHGAMGAASTMGHGPAAAPSARPGGSMGMTH